MRTTASAAVPLHPASVPRRSSGIPASDHVGDRLFRRIILNQNITSHAVDMVTVGSVELERDVEAGSLAVACRW